MRKSLRRLAVIAVFMIIVAGIVTSVASASYGRAQWTGYFMNNFSDWGDKVYLDGLMIYGSTAQERANSFISTMRAYSTDTGNNHDVGTAFIVNTMLGRSAPGSGTIPVSSADIDELQTRLNAFVAGGGIISFNDTYSYTRNTYKQNTYKDVAWYDTPGTAGAWVFSKGGTEYYVIKYDCANPLGAFPGIPRSPSYDINGTSTITNPGTPAYPGSVFNLNHTLTNVGPDQSPSIAKNIFNYNPSTGGESAVPGTYGVHGVFPVWYTGNYPSTLTVPASAVAGERYCQRIGWDPDAYIGGVQYRHGRSTPACVTVVYKYTLTPQVNTTVTTAPALAPVTFQYSVRNNGPTKTYTTGVGQREITVPPNVTINFGANVRDDVDCPTYTSMGPGVTCRTVAQPSRIFQTGTTPLTSETYTIPAGTPAGTRICRVLSVISRDEQQPIRSSAPWHNRDSIVSCVTVSRSPISAIIGSDASAGGSLTANCTGTAGFKGSNSSGFGSFGEYGLIATGPITNFSSAGFMSNGLTFANSGTNGYYKSTHCITDIKSAYAIRGPAAPLASAPTLTLPMNGTNDYRYASGVTLNTSTGLKGKYLIYAPGQTVRITGNITYQKNIAHFADAASLVIIAQNIDIDAGVTQIDGVLYATNRILTCAQSGTSTGLNPVLRSGGPCDTPTLLVNGALISENTVIATRTSGGNIVTDSPSEIYRLRPEAFLAPIELGTGSVLTTVSETELPPRN